MTAGGGNLESALRHLMAGHLSIIERRGRFRDIARTTMPRETCSRPALMRCAPQMSYGEDTHVI